MNPPTLEEIRRMKDRDLIKYAEQTGDKLAWNEISERANLLRLKKQVKTFSDDILMLIFSATFSMNKMEIANICNNEYMSRDPSRLSLIGFDGEKRNV